MSTTTVTAPPTKTRLTVPEVCQVTGLSFNAVYTHIRTGRLVSVMVGRHREVELTELVAFQARKAEFERAYRAALDAYNTPLHRRQNGKTP